MFIEFFFGPVVIDYEAGEAWGWVVGVIPREGNGEGFLNRLFSAYVVANFVGSPLAPACTARLVVARNLSRFAIFKLAGAPVAFLRHAKRFHTALFPTGLGALRSLFPNTFAVYAIWMVAIGFPSGSVCDWAD